MAKQTPAQLADRADLIVLGRPNFGNPGSCSPFGLERSCISFVIQEQIRGTAPANPVLIYSVIPFYRPFESGVLVFLRKDATGTYEIVSGPAGFIGLDETGTDRQGVALTEWRRRVREAGRD